MRQSSAAILMAAALCASARADEGAALRLVQRYNGQIIRDDRLPGRAVVEVSLFDSQVTDAELKELQGFGELSRLNLGACRQLTAAGLRELKRVNKLTALGLNFTTVSDEDLAALQGLEQMTELFLFDTRVSDAGLKELHGLKQLTSLDVLNRGVTEAGVKELRKALPGCKIQP